MRSCRLRGRPIGSRHLPSLHARRTRACGCCGLSSCDGGGSSRPVDTTDLVVGVLEAPARSRSSPPRSASSTSGSRCSPSGRSTSSRFSSWRWPGARIRAPGRGCEHARVQLVLPRADPHLSSPRGRELARARPLPRRRGRRERARGACPSAGTRSAAAGARGGAPRRGGDIALGRRARRRRAGRDRRRAPPASRSLPRLDHARPDAAPVAEAVAIPARRGARRLGTHLRCRLRDRPTNGAARRLLPGLASLLAIALDRESSNRAPSRRRRCGGATRSRRRCSGGSHDLRSPLTAIAAAAGGLEHPGLELDANDRAELVETIVTETAGLEHMVADLLDLSRLQAGAASPVRELWSVDELVGAALDELRDDGATAVNVPADLPPVEVDAAQTRRVLVNLLENAPGMRAPPRVSGSVRRRRPGMRSLSGSKTTGRASRRSIPRPSSSRSGGARAARAATASASRSRVALPSRTAAASAPSRGRGGASLVLTLPAASSRLVEAPR